MPLDLEDMQSIPVSHIGRHKVDVRDWKRGQRRLQECTLGTRLMLCARPRGICCFTSLHLLNVLNLFECKRLNQLEVRVPDSFPSFAMGTRNSRWKAWEMEWDDSTNHHTNKTDYLSKR